MYSHLCILMYLYETQQHFGNQRCEGLFICGFGWVGFFFFAHSNPKLSHLQAVLPKYVDKHLFCDENSDFGFIISLWQLRYLWKELNNMEFIPFVQAPPPVGFLGRWVPNTPFSPYKPNDLLSFLMPIKHPRKRKEGRHQSCHTSYASQPKACPLFWVFYSLGRSQQHHQLSESSCLRSCLPKLLNLFRAYRHQGANGCSQQRWAEEERK